MRVTSWDGLISWAVIVLLKLYLENFYVVATMPSFIICVVVALILLCSISSTAATATSAGSLSLYALNTNGFVHSMKIDATNQSYLYPIETQILLSFPKLKLILQVLPKYPTMTISSSKNEVPL